MKLRKKNKINTEKLFTYFLQKNILSLIVPKSETLCSSDFHIAKKNKKKTEVCNLV